MATQTEITHALAQMGVAELGTCARVAQVEAGAPNVLVCWGCASVVVVEGPWDRSVGQCGMCRSGAGVSLAKVGDVARRSPVLPVEVEFRGEGWVSYEPLGAVRAMITDALRRGEYFHASWVSGVLHSQAR